MVIDFGSDIERPAALLWLKNTHCFFNFLHSTMQTLMTYMHTHSYEHTYANSTYEHLRKTEHPVDLKISEFTIGASFTMRTLLTT
jgi:hypothetical protein